MKKRICIIVAVFAVVTLLLASVGTALFVSKRSDVTEGVKCEVNDGYGYYSDSKSQSVYSEEGSDYDFTDESSNAVKSIKSERKLIKTASINVETEKYDDFNVQLKEEINKLGGYIEKSDESNNNYQYSGSRFEEITVRIPAEKLDEFLDCVSSNAVVTSKSVEVEDITDSYIDVQSRITALKTEQKALLGILAKAESVEDLITVQNRLTEVNAELEGHKSRLKDYDNQVDYSKIYLSIAEVERESYAGDLSFGDEILSRLKNNTYNIRTALRTILIWFVSSIPYFVIIAILFTIIFFVIRKIVKKAKNK